jgi:hypothetical protein
MDFEWFPAKRFVSGAMAAVIRYVKLGEGTAVRGTYVAQVSDTWARPGPLRHLRLYWPSVRRVPETRAAH